MESQEKFWNNKSFRKIFNKFSPDVEQNFEKNR